MSFADLELLRQGVRLEPLLQAICDFLDKQPVLIERVRRDLVRDLKEPDKGRHGLTAPQVLRALVLSTRPVRATDRLSRRLASRCCGGCSCVAQAMRGDD